MTPYIDFHTHSEPLITPEVVAIRSVDLSTEGNWLEREEAFAFARGRASRGVKEQYLPAKTPISLGLHPWYIEKATLSAQLKQLQHYAQLPQVVAIGECGVDRYSRVDISLQKESFMEQCRLAYENSLPCVLHVVKAWEELFACIKQLEKQRPTFVVHGFRGKNDLAQSLISKGFYLSLGVHYSVSSLHTAWQAERLFLETDKADFSILSLYQKVALDLQLPIATVRENIFHRTLNLLPIAPLLSLDTL
ncbi:TatD family hydrolase [Porphyromonas circumdentaria]|uniref:TatD family hydrolase n=1 Tax=Porphyromonas circumdentaria TaxID=29524 RepID=UPI0026DCBE7E|nr:TatD family hydrolase [Porphyromonas circumdentaria]MDO4722315.1 TatD family hydrolase [Porphyromonas circumdentaria]